MPADRNRSKQKKRAGQLSTPITPPLERTPALHTPTPSTAPIDNEEDIETSEFRGNRVEASKRDKRRAKEALRKAEEDAQKHASKDARKSARKSLSSGDSLRQQDGKLDKGDGFIVPKAKNRPMNKGNKSKSAMPSVEKFSEDQVASAVENVREKREKMIEKWEDQLPGKTRVVTQVWG